MKERQFYDYLSTLLSLDLGRREISIKVYNCDLCNETITGLPNDFESRIDSVNEINDSFESEYDKQEPRLMLCLFCKSEYNISS
jgi:hypothetical protein